jgi:hypothetical protein
MRPKTKSDARKTAVRYPQHGFAKIADACQKSGDIPTYDELKKAMASKMKTLPAGAPL